MDNNLKPRDFPQSGRFKNTEEVIDFLLSLANLRDQLIEDGKTTHGIWGKEERTEKYNQWSRMLLTASEGIIQGHMMDVVMHYEKKLAKAESESMRMFIIRQAIREQFEEERAKISN